MTITDVRVRKIASEGKMKAIVSVTFDNEFVVHDIKVIEGQNGLFIAMPSRKTPDGEFKDIAHPINTETRERIQGAILEAYEKAVSEESLIVSGYNMLVHYCGVTTIYILYRKVEIKTLMKYNILRYTNNKWIKCNFVLIN